MKIQSTQEIIKADPAARRQALLILIIGSILGILILKFLMPLLINYLHTLPTKTSIRILLVFLSLLSIIPLSIGFFTLKLGLKIIRTESFPAPGTKVIKDTLLLRGKQARERGILLVILSIMMMACAIVIMVMPYKINKVFTATENVETSKQPWRLRNAPADF